MIGGLSVEIIEDDLLFGTQVIKRPHTRRRQLIRRWQHRMRTLPQMPQSIAIGSTLYVNKIAMQMIKCGTITGVSTRLW